MARDYLGDICFEITDTSLGWVFRPTTGNREQIKRNTVLDPPSRSVRGLVLESKFGWLPSQFQGATESQSDLTHRTLEQNSQVDRGKETDTEMQVTSQRTQ